MFVAIRGPAVVIELAVVIARLHLASQPGQVLEPLLAAEVLAVERVEA